VARRPSGALIGGSGGATLAGVIETAAGLPRRLLRRELLLGLLAAGGAVVAACNTESRDAARSTTTVPSQTTVAPTTTTTAPPMTYQVNPGDTLISIAEFFGVSPAVIAAANQLANADQLTAGQVLVIPPAPPPQVVVTPSVALIGRAFTFTLTGAKAGEIVTFEIDAPGGSTFTGPPHGATPEGSVTTSYRTDAGDDAGIYHVVATGDQGTSVQASFRVIG